MPTQIVNGVDGPAFVNGIDAANIAFINGVEFSGGVAVQDWATWDGSFDGDPPVLSATGFGNATYQNNTVCDHNATTQVWFYLGSNVAISGTFCTTGESGNVTSKGAEFTVPIPANVGSMPSLNAIKVEDNKWLMTCYSSTFTNGKAWIVDWTGAAFTSGVAITFSSGVVTTSGTYNIVYMGLEAGAPQFLLQWNVFSGTQQGTRVRLITYTGSTVSTSTGVLLLQGIGSGVHVRGARMSDTEAVVVWGSDNTSTYASVVTRTALVLTTSPVLFMEKNDTSYFGINDLDVVANSDGSLIFVSYLLSDGATTTGLYGSGLFWNGTVLAQYGTQIVTGGLEYTFTPRWAPDDSDYVICVGKQGPSPGAIKRWRWHVTDTTVEYGPLAGYTPPITANNLRKNTMFSTPDGRIIAVFRDAPNNKNAWSIITTIPTPAYIQNVVHKDITTASRLTAGFTFNSTVFSLSLWINRTTGVACRVLDGGPNGNTTATPSFQMTATGGTFMTTRDVSDANRNVEYNGTNADPGGTNGGSYFNILYSRNGSKQTMWVFDVSIASSQTVNLGTSSRLAKGPLTIGGNDVNVVGVCDMSDLWFDDSFIDFDVEANRRKFVSASGEPVRLGTNGELPTGAAPLIFMGDTMVAADWNAGENRGTVGNFNQVVGAWMDVPATLKFFPQRHTGKGYV